MKQIFTNKSKSSNGNLFHKLSLVFVFLVLNLLSIHSIVFAEGSRQLIPDPTRNQGAIQIWDGGAGSAALRTFLTYNASREPLKRLNIKICNVGEKVYIGMVAQNNDVFLRVKDPSGNTIQLLRVSSTGGTSVVPTVNRPNNYTSLYVNAGGNIINASGSAIAAPNQFTYRMAFMNTMTGFVANYNQAAAGPSVQSVATANAYPVANGYRNPFFFIASATGDYFIEANPVFPDSVVAAGAFTTMSNRRFPFFDITVTDAADRIQTGRVWSGFWDMTCFSFTNLFNGSFFVYTTDSIVTKLTLNNIQPFGFIVMCNSFGLQNTGNFVNDRRSRAGIFQSPEYKLFLNDPDNNCYPTGRFGQLNAPPNITGCDANNRCVNINVDKAGKAQIILQLSQIVGITPPLVDRSIAFDLKVGNNCVPWDTKDGAGTIVPAGVTIPTQVDYFTGITHLPMYDVERNLNGYSVSLTRPKIGGKPIPFMFWDDSQIPLATTNRASSADATVYPTSPNIPLPWLGNTITSAICGLGTSNNGAPAGYTPFTNQLLTTSTGLTTATGCMNGLQMVNLTGCVNAAGCHLWNWNANNSTQGDYGNVNTINMWWYANILSTTAGFNPGYITIDAETRIQRTLLANGKYKVRDSTVCANNNNYRLSGIITSTGFVGTLSGYWKTALPKSIAGTFFPDSTSLTAIYRPSATDLARDSAKVYLYANNTDCPKGVLDSLIIRFSPSPRVTVVAPTNVCANNSVINLNAGTLTVASGVVWGGRNATGAALTGTFSPPTSLTPTYTLGAGETPASAPGTVLIFIATTTGNGKCNPVASTQVTVTVNPAFTISIPGTTLICQGIPNQSINATISNGITTTTGLWSTNGDGRFGNNLSTSTVLNTFYTFGANDRINNGVTLSLISTGNGNCNASSGNVVINMFSAPTASLSPAPTVCQNNPTASFTGIASLGFTSLLWTDITPGTGSFSPSNNVLRIAFTPTTAEINSGLARINFTVNKTGCLPASSPATININRAPIVDAGNPQTVCANNPTITLTGKIIASATGEGSSATWSGGGGNFFPSNIITPTTTGVTYTLSNAEVAANSTSLILTSNNNGTCLPVKDTVKIFVTPAPSINPISSVKVCANNPVVTLTGVVNSPFSGVWSTGGAGSLVNTSTTGVYTANNADITAGSVNFTFTSTNNGTCTPVNRTTTLTFDASPSISIGSNQTICANNPSFTLSGNVSGGASGVSWLGGTNASFSPSRTVSAPTYTPTAAEISAGLLTLSVTSTGNLSNCRPDTKSVTITFSPSPVVSTIGTSTTVCANNPKITLRGSVLIGGVTSTGIWTGGNGGNYSPSTGNNTVYTPTASDISSGSVLFTFTPNNVGNCLPSPTSALVGFDASPAVNPGPTQTICGNVGFVNLTGSITFKGATTSGIWTGGSGTFSPVNPTILNTRYFPSPTEISAKIVNLVLTSTNSTLGCNAVSSTVAINFTDSPVVKAGNNQTICGNSFTPVTFSSSVTNAPSFTWSCTGCNAGSFVNTNTLTPTYTPNAADKAKGSVTFKLTSAGNNCIAVSDSFKISYTNAPVANAGPPINICTNDFPVQLAATGSQGTWSGPGVFSPNNSTLNATYTPTASQSGPGSFTLTYTTNATPGCSPVSSIVTVSVTSSPVVDAGNKMFVCANAATVSLNGSNNSASQVWTSDGTGIFSNPNILNPTFTPSNADILKGRVKFTLTSQGSVCRAATDTVSIIINPKPIVVSMANQSFCSNVTTLSFNGTVTIAGGGIWRTSGTGRFNNNTSNVQTIIGVNMATNYTPSAADLLLPSFTISLTSTLNGLCNAETQQFNVSFSSAPVVNAGPARTICSDKDTIQLRGQVTNAGGGFWTSTGTGVFNNPSNLNAIYTPSVAELGSSSFTLRLTSQGNNGTCSAATSDLVVNVLSKPNPNPGSALTICADENSIPLSGFSPSPFGGEWSSSGSGTFTTGLVTTSILGTTYTLSAGDKLSPSFILFLKSTGSTVCGQVVARKVITVTPVPVVNPGSNLVICGDANGVLLSGNIPNASGGIWTTTAVGGSFVPNITSPFDLNASNKLDAIYQPSATAKANGEIIVLRLTNLPVTGCADVSRTITLTVNPKPTITANPISPVCADTFSIPVSGTFTNLTTGNFLWSTSSDGTFSPSPSPSSPDVAVIPKTEYRPSITDKLNGIVNLTLSLNGNGACAPVSSTIPLTITSIPTVSAGQNRTICANINTITLAGSVSAEATAQQWSTSGSGTFSGINLLNPTYSFSSSDKSAGQVTLTLRTTAQGNCKPVSSSIVIKIVPQPIANAGSAISICETTTIVGLSGSITTVSGSGVWSTNGTGRFTPSNNSLSASYIPSASDFLSTTGSVAITLSTLNSGSCGEVSNSINLSFLKKPVVKAGTDKSICADASGIAISGTVTGAGGGLWTSKRGGTFTPNPNSLNITYKPSAAALTALNDTLYLTSTGNAPCSAITDTLVVNISPVPTVSAGPDISFCSTFDAPYNLSLASVSGATGIKWTTSGNGRFIPSDSATNPQYDKGLTDVASGGVTLTATTFGNGPCSAQTARMRLKYDVAPLISAGPVLTYCAEDSPSQTILINGSVNGRSTTSSVAGYTFDWRSNGSGTFVDNTQFVPSYVPSDLDKILGNVQFTFSATNNGSTCGSVSSSTNVFLTPPPVVSPGVNRTICPSQDTIILNGIFGVRNVTSPSPGVITNGGLTATGVSFGAGTVSIPGWTDLGFGFFANGTTTATSATFYPVDGVVPDWTLVSAGLYTSNGVSVTNANNFINGTATILGYTYDSASGFYVSGTTSATGTDFVGGTYLPSRWNPTTTTNPNPGSFSNGLVTVSGGAFWSSTSPGASFSTTNTLMNGAVYQITAADRANGQVVISLNSTGFGSCTPVKGDMVITFASPITVNPGANQTICSNNPTVTLSGTVTQGATVFTTITGVASWSSPSGGTFGDPNSLRTTFTPTPSQINSGQVTLFLTSSATSSLLTGSCTSVRSSITITFTQPTSISAGNTVLACQDASTVAISGNLGIATVGGRWSSSGTGTFANATSLGTNYLPSNADKLAGFVTLSLTSINNGNCGAVTSTVQVAFTPSLTLSGSNLSVCADANSVSLSGFPTFITVPGWNYLSNGFFNSTNTITGGVNWTTTSVGGTFSNVLGSISTTSYNLTATDIANGNVVVKLNTTGFGSCQTKTADYNISIIGVPTANITAPSTVCGVVGPIALTATVTGASGGIWSSGSGAGVFSSSASSGTTFGVSFTPTASQIASGKVSILLTVTNTGLCQPVTKSTTIFFQSPPTIQAGSNISTCTVPSLNVSGTLSLPATVSASNPVWTSNGSGLFSTNTVNGTNISSVYTLGVGDTGINPLTLCMTSTANGICTSSIISCLTVNFTTVPGYTVATPTPTICGNNLPILLSASGPSGTWITTGAGVINNPTSLNATYTPTQAEINAGSTVIFNITSSGVCGLVTPGTITVKLIPGPTVGGFATPTVLCKNNTTLDLSLITVSGATSGVWKTSGNGQFIQGGVNVGGNVLNYSPFIVGGALTYVPSANDVTSNSVILKFVTSNNLSGCKSDSANVNVVFTPAPTVNGGGNQSFCVNVPTITLTGSVSLSGTTATGLSAIWSTTSTGSLVSTQNGTNVVGVYSPTATDYANGSVKLFIRSTLTTPGVCSQVSDSVIVTFNPLPSFAGLSTQTVCGDGSTSIQLQGTLSTSSSIIWTGGLGTFTPNRNTLNAFYQPDASETGIIHLFVQATSSGSNCVSNLATVNIAIQNKPTISVGGPYTICSNNLVVTLSASGTGSSGYSWTKSTGSGSLSSDNTILGTSIYTASSDDVTSSGVNLTATSVGNGVCAAVSASTGIIFTTPPTINAGGNRLICINNPTVTLSGSFSGSAPSGVVWGLVSAGTGTFTGVTTSTSVVFTATNTTAPITIAISSTGVNLCNTVTDNMVLSFSPSPVISGVSSAVVCGDTSGVILNADVSVAGGVFWSGGTGIFVTSRNDLKPTYIPSDSEKSGLGSVVPFTITTTGNGNCNSVIATMNLTVTGAPTVTSTGSFTTCATNRTITLTGGFGAPASGAIWSTAGTGVFSSVNTLTGFAIYTASKADSAAGGATFQIKTLGNGLCKAATDTANLTITPAPRVDAGFNQAICADNNSITLTGLVSPYSSFGNTWTTTGLASGSFSSPSSLTTNYLLSPADRLLPSITLMLTPDLSNLGSCNLALATSTVLVTLTPTPIVTASTLGTVCADTSVIQLNGFVTIGATTSTGIWSGGTGTYSPNAALNSTNYILSASEAGTTSTTGISFVFTSNNNGTCIGNYTTTVNLAINPAPTLVAPSGFTKPCENNPLLPLTATGSNANLFWSSASLSPGTFTGGSPGAAVTYQPSAQEFAAGSVNLQINAKSIFASCKDKTITFPISLDRQPEAQAIVGSNLSICKDQTTINLVGYVINARTTSSWNSPNGGSAPNPLPLPFSPVLVPGSSNTYQINASYQVDPSDIVRGSVEFVLDAFPFGSCNLVTAQFSVSFKDLPAVTATSATICADANAVNLTSTISTAASGVVWSGGNGTFSNAGFQNTVYQPTNAELTSGLVGLSVRTINTNGCTDVTENVSVIIDPLPNVSVSTSSISACANTAGVSLTGFLTNVTSAQWSYSSGIGTGTFTPVNSTVTSFVPSAADLAAGTANVKITAFPSNTCLPVSKNVAVNFESVPVVSAGLGQTICGEAGTIVNLNGLINGVATTSSNVQWTTTGSGIFGNPNSSSTTYTPSASDLPLGSSPSFVTLNLTYNDPGQCGPVSQLVTITITSTPIVSAEITSSCNIEFGLPLIGKVQFGNSSSTGFWTTTGSGTFTQTVGNINASYLPGFTDIQNGLVKLNFTPTSQGTCKLPYGKSVNLIIQTRPVAITTLVPPVCSGSDVILLGNSNKDVSYSWYQNGVQIGTNKSVSVTVTTSSIFQLEVQDQNGCTDSKNVEVNSISPPNFTLSGNSLTCYKLPFQLKASLNPAAIGTTTTGSDFISYKWLKDNNPVGNILDSVSDNGPGTYQIVFNYGQCNVQKSTKVNPVPVIKGLDRLLCENSSVTLSVNYIERGLYTWKSQGSGVVLSLGTSSSISINNVSNGGGYLVSVTDSNGCDNTDTLTVKTVSKPIINVDPVSACVNDTAILNGIASNIDTTIYKPRYDWYVGAFKYTNDTTVSKIGVTQGGQYKLIYSIGECVSKDSADVVMHPRAITNPLRDRDMCEESDSTVGILIDGGDGFKYKWKSDTESLNKKYFTGDSTRAITVKRANKTYYVQVYNEFNCPTKDSIRVTNACFPKMFVADAFTPNGDQTNDDFKLHYKYVGKFEFTVFSRWGEIIYYTEDPTKPWDGTYKNDPMPAGVYPWTMKYEGDNNKFKGPYNKVGKVTIIR